MILNNGYLVLMHGYTGVGKTTAANKISRLLGYLGFKAEVIDSHWLDARKIYTIPNWYASEDQFKDLSAQRKERFLAKIRMARLELRKGAFVIIDTTSKKKEMREAVYELIGDEEDMVSYNNFYVIHCTCSQNAATAGLLLKPEFMELVKKQGFELTVNAAKSNLKNEVITTEHLVPKEIIRGQYRPKIINYQTLYETVGICNYELYEEDKELRKRCAGVSSGLDAYLSTYSVAHSYLSKYLPDLQARLAELNYSGNDWVLETIVAALAERTRTKEFIDLFSKDDELSTETYIEFLKMKENEAAVLESRIERIKF